jgi:hypothetical protein
MKLEELLNVMDDGEKIDILVDKSKNVTRFCKILFVNAEVIDVKNSLAYKEIKNSQVWFIGWTANPTIEIRILEKGEN